MASLPVVEFASYWALPGEYSDMFKLSHYSASGLIYRDRSLGYCFRFAVTARLPLLWIRRVLRRLVTASRPPALN